MPFKVPDTPSLSNTATQRLADYRKRRTGGGLQQSQQQPSANNSFQEFKKRSNKFNDDNFSRKSHRSEYTPSHSHTPLPSYSWDSTPRHAIDDTYTHTKEYQDEQLRLDRDWYSYMGEEGGVAGDSEHNPFSQYDDLDNVSQTQRKQRLSAKQLQFNKDNDAWETNRMVQSGLQSRPDLDFDFDDENESKVHVLVHDLKPPFLDGRMVFTKQLEPINPLRDPTSDLAVFARKGSALVRLKRAQAERQKASEMFFGLILTNHASGSS